MPFAGYPDFAACTRAHSDVDDPGAYCGEIYKRVKEGRKKKGSSDERELLGSHLGLVYNLLR